mmetsp:Transcript_38856/g.110860  ORF Transcript_38856/g.110860 Transcript_38856/m.110860 type:complete len:292 (+) Transcript_38856:616-1491(+)
MGKPGPDENERCSEGSGEHGVGDCAGERLNALPLHGELQVQEAPQAAVETALRNGLCMLVRPCGDDATPAGCLGTAGARDAAGGPGGATMRAALHAREALDATLELRCTAPLAGVAKAAVSPVDHALLVDVWTMTLVGCPDVSRSATVVVGCDANGIVEAPVSGDIEGGTGLCTAFSKHGLVVLAAAFSDDDVIRIGGGAIRQPPPCSPMGAYTRRAEYKQSVSASRSTTRCSGWRCLSCKPSPSTAREALSFRCRPAGPRGLLAGVEPVSAASAGHGDGGPVDLRPSGRS